MSRTIFSPATINTPGAWCSHDPLYFPTLPQAKSAMTLQAASRLLYISSWKLSSEAARDEPRLRKILGHASLYDKTRTFSQHRRGSPNGPAGDEELSTYLREQVPSFREFQAAIQDQLATMAKVTAAASQFTVDDYKRKEEEGEDDDEDSDYDSYDGDDWSDEDPAAESDDSCTDNESVEGQSSECSSPTSPSHEGEDDLDLWAVRPVTFSFDTTSNPRR